MSPGSKGLRSLSFYPTRRRDLDSDPRRCPLGPRMKRLGLLLLIAGMASTALPAQAQLARPQFGMGAGMAFPAGKFHSSLRGEGFGSGLQGIAFVAFKVHPIPGSLRLEANYGLHGAN